VSPARAACSASSPATRLTARGFAAGFRAALLAGCLIEVIGYVIAVMTVRNRRAPEG
jgi:hypothetical protein